MLSYSELNRRITGQACCCKGPQGAQGAQGETTIQSVDVSTGISTNPAKDPVAYDISNILLLNSGSTSDGFNIKFVDTTHVPFLPFGGDFSNNAPLDNLNNPIQLNHSSWLKIELEAKDWNNISSAARPLDHIGYIPIYWKK